VLFVAVIKVHLFAMSHLLQLQKETPFGIKPHTLHSNDIMKVIMCAGHSTVQVKHSNCLYSFDTLTAEATFCQNNAAPVVWSRKGCLEIIKHAELKVITKKDEFE
jgi:hypothetical protein